MWLSSRRSLYGLYPYKSSMIGLENLGDPSGNWDIVETIGKGTYGKVYRVTNKKDGSQAAVKVLDPINVSQIEACLLWKMQKCRKVSAVSFSCLSALPTITGLGTVSVKAHCLICRNIM